MHGRVGIWSGELRRHPDPGLVKDAARELEALGYAALFIPGGAGGDDLFDAAERLLDATSRVEVLTSVVNVWMHAPDEVAAATARLRSAHDDRFVAGLGISHAPLVDRTQAGRYRRPLATMSAYLDALDAAQPPVRPAQRLLGALGPRMLELARDRTAGSNPYFVTVEHTRFARSILGPERLLAVELPVVLEADPDRARARARGHMQVYLALPNYVNALLAHGIGEHELVDGGSEHLVDAVVAWGDEAAIAQRVDEHLAAGADHVCLQVIGAGDGEPPRAEWRALAEVLTPAA
jgi:probable F420-dependent oxidoreductase